MAATSKGFLSLVLSPAVLAPLILGLGGALAMRLTSDKHNHLAGFVAVVGTLGAVGTLSTLLLARGRRLDPVMARKRQEMQACLEELADGSRFAASAESDQPAVAAQVERL